MQTLRYMLGPGQIQVEAGFTWERNDAGAALTKTTTSPQIEMHGGITPRVELSIAWDGLVSVAVPESTPNAGERSTGVADVRLGAKFGLVNRPRVNAALIAYGNLPVGSEAFSSHYADPRARFAWAILASSRVGLSGPWISEPRVKKTAVSVRNQQQACHWGQKW